MIIYNKLKSYVRNHLSCRDIDIFKVNKHGLPHLSYNINFEYFVSECF